ncbi:unnamed protein product [Mytilus edulis]|uniref:Integrase catalytic domain-containing protein n=2 Tax=Mytilus TaxID=6548 RepID=A0A8B6G0W8_MYTGA|nr:unnamed protein product [Mytilus edulis]VDH94119.1 Hypothetical predicted protein [Mytilus galloprovincialis]VDI57143.1 Hypothetical predicted protein [Mytilus galloprovincialis]
MTQKQKENYVKRIWTNPNHPGAFAGPDKLLKVIRSEGKFDISRAHLKKILAKEDTYSVQKPSRKTFRRNRVVVAGLNAQWDGDLASMENVSKYNSMEKYNSDIKFLLILIDIFSRFLIVKPLKDKKSDTVTSALKEIFKTGNRRPKTVRFDLGGEFQSSVKKYLKKEKINVFYTHNSKIKSNYAERVIRTLKNRIYSYFMENQTSKYIDVLQKLVNSYNNTPHQSLGGATPASVTKINEDEIRYIQYLVRKKAKSIEVIKRKKKKQVYKFKIGDIVRISQLKRVFEKGYQENWTLEYFKVSKRFKRENQDIYKLKDTLNDDVKGSFYRYEVQKIDQSQKKLYKIETILKTRKVVGKEQVLVKWLGWPSKFNSWILKKSIKDIK